MLVDIFGNIVHTLFRSRVEDVGDENLDGTATCTPESPEYFPRSLVTHQETSENKENRREVPFYIIFLWVYFHTYSLQCIKKKSQYSDSPLIIIFIITPICDDIITFYWTRKSWHTIIPPTFIEFSRTLISYERSQITIMICSLDLNDKSRLLLLDSKCTSSKKKFKLY